MMTKKKYDKSIKVKLGLIDYQINSHQIIKILIKSQKTNCQLIKQFFWTGQS